MSVETAAARGRRDLALSFHALRRLHISVT